MMPFNLPNKSRTNRFMGGESDRRKEWKVVKLDMLSVKGSIDTGVLNTGRHLGILPTPIALTVFFRYFKT